MDPLSSVKRKKSQEDVTIASPSKKARKRVRYGLFTQQVFPTHDSFPDELTATHVESAIVENKR